MCELGALNPQLERQWGVTIQLRAGIDTGEVATGDPLTDEIFATGDAVNVAARLEQAASPMTIVIGERTRDLTRLHVEAQRLEPLRVKGKSQPVCVPCHLDCTRRGPARGRSARGADRRGRCLCESFERALAEHRCDLATIVGEAGIGKTRLAADFVNGLADGTIVMRGRCLSYGEGIAFWPIAEAIRSFAGLSGLGTAGGLPRSANSWETSPMPTRSRQLSPT